MRILGVRAVADNGLRECGPSVSTDKSTDGIRRLSERERVKVPEEEIRRVNGLGEDGLVFVGGTADEGLRSVPQNDEDASGVSTSSSSSS